MTPFAIAGYWYYTQNWADLGKWALVIYSVMSMLVLGHYLITPPWDVSLKINAFILLETLAAVVLLLYVVSGVPSTEPTI
ncbi:hypothetical protein [Rhodopirellula halodulae]|uniref:hypothetical protein n=1 Tax=Rhodopirellula halodulae TaxID=2894198 RepID=UPI001E4069CF|nr:hypothetical protein [Rhodopirellula sp. JC737]MCC9655268.1 hypothetical protein [Rhodopirellula sp. JC737]